MIKRVRGPVLLAAAVFSAWLAWSRSPAVGQPEPLPAPRPGGGPQYVGVASCASMACHHFNGPQGEARSEYSTWSNFDKHAQAYAALENERSQRIVRNLYGAKAKATETDLCLKCHATYETKMVKGDRFYLGDGVGCESCHGPAGNYLETHYLAGFKELSSEEKERRGLWNTKDLSNRTKLCASCHVGDAKREVNHDLIAAGHPRLNFEMGGYHGIYAKHWPHAADVGRYSDFEARLWLVGQLTTARASIDLLRDRALQSQKDAKPWPEFAEYACYACHKDVKVDSPTQRSGYYTQRHPGSFPFGTWYLSMTPELPKLRKWVGGDPAKLTGKLKTLVELMEQPGPDAVKVAKEAGEVSDVLGGLLRQASARQPLDDGQLRAYFKRFVSDGARGANTMTWDKSAQLYLSLAALHQALFDRGDPLATSGKLKPGLEAVKKRLRGAFKKGYDSPVDFDPLADPKKKIPSLGEQLNALREALGN